MVLLVAVQGWRCCGDALVLAWCDGVVMLRRCGGAVMFVGLVRWECGCVALLEWDGAAMSGRCVLSLVWWKCDGCELKRASSAQTSRFKTRHQVFIGIAKDLFFVHVSAQTSVLHV